MSKTRALATWDAFNAELKTHEHEIATLLPRHVPLARFLSSAVAAVKQNPDLLTATPRSLFQALTQSAQDGLLPDGREGVITVYKQKTKSGAWEPTAKWNPMVWGLRKRAKELDRIIIDAQVVHKGDHFIWYQGDEPKIEHHPATLGTPKGDMIGAYAIFKDGDGHILHREVMDAEQIEAVRSQSKQPDGLLWTKFKEEGWKKSAVRRGIKSVPCSESLETILHRDDDLFDMTNGKLDKPALTVVQPPQTGEHKPLPPVAGEDSVQKMEGSSASAAQPEGHQPPEPSAWPDMPSFMRRGAEEEPTVFIDVGPMGSDEAKQYLADLQQLYTLAPSTKALDAIREGAEERDFHRLIGPDKVRAETMFRAAKSRLAGEDVPS